MTHAFVPLLAALLAIAPHAARAADTLDPVQAWEEDRTRIFDASEIDLAGFLWTARPIVVFANTPRDPSFEDQMELLVDEMDQLIDRDVVIVVDTDPADPSELRTRLRPRGFMMVLIGKDGQVKLRKPFPWTVRELNRSIDKMPMRQRETRERDG